MCFDWNRNINAPLNCLNKRFVASTSTFYSELAIKTLNNISVILYCKGESKLDETENRIGSVRVRLCIFSVAYRIDLEIIIFSGISYDVWHFNKILFIQEKLNLWFVYFV